MGSPPPTRSFPVSLRLGRPLVFLFRSSRADWLVALLGSRLSRGPARAGPASSADEWENCPGLQQRQKSTLFGAVQAGDCLELQAAAGPASPGPAA